MKRKIIVMLLLLEVLSFSSSTVMASSHKTAITTLQENEITPKADKIEYVYKIINGALYKRLYNYSRNEWVGDWILVS